VQTQRFILSVTFVILASLTLFKILQASDARSNSNLSSVEFFKGTWECKLQGSPFTKFRWSVAEGLDGAWLIGFIEVSGNKVSNDCWRVVEGKIERFAFTRDGSFLKVESSGWESGILKFTGSVSNKMEEVATKETITQKSAREFRALWEKMDKNRKWFTQNDEICTK
jgi:hypothetical protein